MAKTITEKLKDGREISGNIWNDSTTNYITYNLPEEFGNSSEQDLIKLAASFESFGLIPAEYTRQAGIADGEAENGKVILELTFVLGNKE